MMSEVLRVRVHQTAPVHLDPTENLRRMRARVGSESADLHLFPELSHTGYDLGVRAREFAVRPTDEAPDLGSEGVALSGLPWEEEDARLFNAAAASQNGRWLGVHRKVHLPTYGMFDEGRIFAPGRAAPLVLDVAGWKVGVLICEDLWHPALSWLAALHGADLVVVLAAAPGRGVGEAPWNYASDRPWMRLAEAVALQHGVGVVLCNRVGIEGAVTFAGGSFALSPQGDLLHRAGAVEEESFSVEFRQRDIRTARRTFSHLRDEDAIWVGRHLLGPDSPDGKVE